MQAALLQRFQGALLGATLGEFLSLPNQVLGDRSSWPLEPARLTAQLPMSELMWHYARILAESGQVAGRVDEAAGAAHRLANLSTSTAAIGLLPIALFFHDADWQLTPQLQAATATWQNSTLELTGLRWMAQAIAVVLSERLQPTQLLPRLLRLGGEQRWQASLALMQAQLMSTHGLAAVQSSLVFEDADQNSANTIAVALYCFLSTPAAFDLSIRRALRLGLSASGLALIGALSGAHNGLSGIPIVWRLAILAHLAPDLNPLPLAQRLLTTWAGVYEPAGSGAELSPAIAAPEVIRRVRRQTR